MLGLRPIGFNRIWRIKAIGKPLGGGRINPTVGMADSDSRCGPRIRFGGVITRSNPGQVRPLLCHPFCSFPLLGFRTPVRKCKGCEALVQDHSKKAKAHADTCAGLVAIGLWKTPVNPIAVVPRSGGPSATVQAVARQVCLTSQCRLLLMPPSGGQVCICK